MKFSIMDFFPADLVTFTEEILKLHFLCSVCDVTAEDFEALCGSKIQESDDDTNSE